VRAIQREPGWLVQPDMRPPCPLLEDSLEDLERRFGSGRGKMHCLELKGIRTGQRAQCDGPIFGIRPDMPVLAIEALHFDVPYPHPLRLVRCSLERDSQRVPHEAMSAIATDEIICSYLLRRVVVSQRRRYAVAVLGESGNSSGEFDCSAAQRADPG